ncbi:MAG: cytochrome c biogenesis protein CcsA [Chloroflexota bacterium]
MNRNLDSLRKPLGALTVLSMSLALLAAFFYAPMERSQGQVQRIFYIHLPIIWLAYLAFFIVFLSSGLYLWKRRDAFDHLAHASAEIGFLFTSLVLVTGSLWARPIWGTWWSWDARLTTTLILWFIYGAYLTLRGVMPHDRQAARYCAVLGIVGFIDIPIIHQSVVWWRTLHPQSIVLAEGGPAMPPAMLQTLGLALMAFSFLYVWLLLERTRLERMRADLRQIKLEQAFGKAP